MRAASRMTSNNHKGDSDAKSNPLFIFLRATLLSAHNLETDAPGRTSVMSVTELPGGSKEKNNGRT